MIICERPRTGGRAHQSKVVQEVLADLKWEKKENIWRRDIFGKQRGRIRRRNRKIKTEEKKEKHLKDIEKREHCCGRDR